MKALLIPKSAAADPAIKALPLSSTLSFTAVLQNESEISLMVHKATVATSTIKRAHWA